MSFTLVLGNKAYSSWSLRPWIALKQAGIAFDEIMVQIGTEGTGDLIRKHSPAGKVPVLKDGDLTVWDSLAIIEYVAEKFPDAGIWPKDQQARALARSISAEMHSGFVPLRNLCNMNTRKHYPGFALTPDVEENVARIDQIWTETRAAHGKSGPFLFGVWTGADAMYAPVVTRFKTYDVKVSEPAREYLEAVLALPAMRDWYAAGAAETTVIEKYEY
jgi:glutathione S-transferase